MPHPPPWPQPHPHAENFDEFWLVRGLPPLPFPDPEYSYADDNRFGPPGTHWVFSWESLVNRQTEPGVAQGTKLAIERIIRKLAIKLPPAGSTSWAVPLPLAPPAQAVEQEFGMAMTWVRTAINGTVGSVESISHVLQWRHKTIPNAPIDATELKAIADKVRDQWVAFLASPGGGAASTTSQNLSPSVTYREVRASILTQDAPGARPVWGPQTQFSPFTTGNVGNGPGLELPWEVAMGISLNTNWRGTSRFRGRLYLGPLSAAQMSVGGVFGTAGADKVGLQFGTFVLAAVKAGTNYEAHVISQKYNTSAAITGVRMGKVPDSQRRRRRSQVESYAQVWGTAVGAA